MFGGQEILCSPAGQVTVLACQSTAANIPIFVLTSKDLTAVERIKLASNAVPVFAKQTFSMPELLNEMERQLKPGDTL